MTGTSIDVGPFQVDLDMRGAYGDELSHAAWAALATVRAKQDEAERVRAEADDYAAKVRAEADSYAAKIRVEADLYAAKSRTAADALEAAAATKQRKAETALAGYREADALAVQAKVDADAQAAKFDRKLADLQVAVDQAQAAVDQALGKLRTPLPTDRSTDGWSQGLRNPRAANMRALPGRLASPGKRRGDPSRSSSLVEPQPAWIVPGREAPRQQNGECGMGGYKGDATPR